MSICNAGLLYFRHCEPAKQSSMVMFSGLLRSSMTIRVVVIARAKPPLAARNEAESGEKTKTKEH